MDKDERAVVGSGTEAENAKVEVAMASPDRAELERMAMLKRLRQLVDGHTDLP
jgi:hypothetical protein